MPLTVQRCRSATAVPLIGESGKGSMTFDHLTTLPRRVESATASGWQNLAVE